ncbi:MAG TPA: tetratricopeptide repeat protein, partial [Verrucomicrobiae bacterium]|nr:tetratricopeptide repeat protein [Verrucomicrobiae bacterium]
RSRTRREAGNPAFLGPTATAAVAIFAALTVVGLVYKNFGAIRAADGDALGRYGALVEKSLPAGGILLCDSDTPGVDAPWRLFAVEFVLARDGKLKNYVPVDTTSLMYAGYHRYLHRKYPAVWPQLVNETDMGMVNPHALPTVVALLSKSNTVYYLHPSAGYYFEQFYLEPHGAVYAMNLLPENTIVPPLPDKDLMAMNEAFWADARGLVSSLAREISSDSFEAETNLSIGQRLFAQFHITTPPDASAALAAMYLSRDMDYWGTILQRAGELEKAGDAFATAEKLNPQNQVAQINLAFNQTLRAGNPQPAQLDDATPNQQVDGPFDEPSYCFQTASSFVSSTFYKQAIASFERVRALAPGNLACRYMLAQLYLVFRHPDDALAALQEPMKQPQTFSLSADNSTQLNVLAAEAYFQKNDLDHGRQLLDLEITRHPTDTNLLTAAAQAYVVHGLYHSALFVINRRLASAPDDATWLFGKGYVQMQMTNYDGAIASLDRVLELQTNNNDALFSRATAYLKSGRLDAAHADYLRLQRVVSNSPPVAYGLGEIAWRRHETNDAVRNYEIFLAGANTNSPEAREVADRLADLKR